jgi:hypothetical protein
LSEDHHAVAVARGAVKEAHKRESRRRGPTALARDETRPDSALGARAQEVLRISGTYGSLRRCAVCGTSLEGKRANASYCSNACRAEAWRLRRLLAGRPVGRYKCLADRMAAYGRARRSSRSQEPREAA